MKRFFPFLALLFASCAQEVSFLHPMPRVGPAIDTIPPAFRGNYISHDRNSLLEVTPQAIIHYYDFELIRRAHLPAGLFIHGDTLLEAKTGKTERVFVYGDSIYRKLRWADTIFRIPRGDQLKKLNDAYFLNRKRGEVWTLNRLRGNAYYLMVGSITDSAAISALSRFAAVSDTDKLRFDMEPGQFQEFMKNHPFISEDSFLRLTPTDTASR